LAWASTFSYLTQENTRRFDIEFADDGHALTLAWG
jgi:hypothetical protein